MPSGTGAGGSAGSHSGVDAPATRRRRRRSVPTIPSNPRCGMAKVTVMEYERVVKLVDGVVKEVLGPGRHSYRRSRTHLHRVDMRPRWISVPGQEVLTADGISV